MARRLEALSWKPDSLPGSTYESLYPAQREAERLILGLRLRDGIPLSWLRDQSARVETWKSLGLLAAADGRCWLTEGGFLLSDSLFVELLPSRP